MFADVRVMPTVVVKDFCTCLLVAVEQQRVCVKVLWKQTHRFVAEFS